MLRILWGYCWQGEANLMQRKYCPWKFGLKDALGGLFSMTERKDGRLSLIMVSQFGNWVTLLGTVVEIPMASCYFRTNIEL